MSHKPDAERAQQTSSSTLRYPDRVELPLAANRRELVALSSHRRTGQENDDRSAGPASPLATQRIEGMVARREIRFAERLDGRLTAPFAPVGKLAR